MEKLKIKTNKTCAAHVNKFDLILIDFVLVHIIYQSPEYLGRTPMK